MYLYLYSCTLNYVIRRLVCLEISHGCMDCRVFVKRVSSFRRTIVCSGKVGAEILESGRLVFTICTCSFH